MTINNNFFANVPETSDRGAFLSVDEEGNIVYSTPEGFTNGYDHFNYTYYNNSGTEEIASVVVDFNAPNGTFPGAFDDTRILVNQPNEDDESPVFEIDVLSNDIVKNPIISQLTQPDGGSVIDTTILTEIESLICNAAGDDDSTAVDSVYRTVLWYTPNFGFTGMDVFNYTVSDELNAITTEVTSASVFVNVYEEGAELFEAVDDAFEVQSGEGMNVLTNDVGSNVISPASTWTLEDLTSGIVYPSSANILFGNEQAIGGWEYDPTATGDDFEQNSNPLGFTVAIGQSINA